MKAPLRGEQASGKSYYRLDHTEGKCSEFFVADGTPTEEVENEPPAVDE